MRNGLEAQPELTLLLLLPFEYITEILAVKMIVSKVGAMTGMMLLSSGNCALSQGCYRNRNCWGGGKVGNSRHI
jgi:hypothetical protein